MPPAFFILFCILYYKKKNSDGIPWHSDHEAFGESIRVFCFGDARPLRFRRSVRGDDGSVELWRYSCTVASCGCYDMFGEARHLWQHSLVEVSNQIRQNEHRKYLCPAFFKDYFPRWIRFPHLQSTQLFEYYLLQVHSHVFK